MNISPHPKRHSFLLMATTAFAVLIAVGFCWQYWVAECQVASGQPIRVIGRYRSPDGATVLTLRNSDDNAAVTIEVSYREGTAQSAGAEWEIDATQPWLYTFGIDNKLWGYSSRLGPHSWHATLEEDAFTQIGIYGGWSGIPESFLQMLPEHSRDIHAKWLAKQVARPQGQDG